MPPRISAKEAHALRKRWQRVNAQERRELRSTPLVKKLQQLAALMASVRQMGWTSALSEGEAEVRERWVRLRKIYCG